MLHSSAAPDLAQANTSAPAGSHSLAVVKTVLAAAVDSLEREKGWVAHTKVCGQADLP